LRLYRSLVAWFRRHRVEPGNQAAYYVYVSDTKIDMLYPQIPTRLSKRISGELSLDFKFVGLSLKESPTDETRYSKLRVVLRYLEETGQVGPIGADSAYFRGELPMKWGLTPDAGATAVVFGGKADSRLIALRGSATHVIGYDRAMRGYQLASPRFDSMPQSASPGFSNMQSRSAKGSLPPSRLSPSQSTQWASDSTEHMVDPSESEVVLVNARDTVEYMDGPSQLLTFTARVLLQGVVHDRQVIVGTPICVALV